MEADLARRGILDMSPYIPGKPVEEVQKEYGLTNIIKMASNENPLKTSPMALEAMRLELEKSYMYPEGSSPTVREAVSRALDIPERNILVAAGGDHVITLMCMAFVNEGEEVITGHPSFKTYEQGTALACGKLVRIPLKKDFSFDLNAMAAAINERTKLIFLCNPNNPTGTIVRRKEVEKFLDKVPAHCIVVFDEAYFEYVSDPDYPNGLDYVRQGRNVMVLRTFSKLYGLAGARVGYGVAPDHLMDIYTRTLPPFPVCRVAQAGAVAALQDSEFVKRVLEENARGRAYLCAQFDKLGLPYAEPHANFVFVDVKTQVAALYPKLLARGIIVRPCGPWGYPTSMRVTIGTMEENETFIRTLEPFVLSAGGKA
ncbi:MAG: histidinol-phosphate transaminase [Candidatus Pelethousia sp.]|nr:histidinol-phosphate transaminase [Candidatus Pelethousia sp.]